MKRLTMISALVLVLLISVTVYAKDYEMTKKAGDYTVLLTIARNPPVTGKNNMAVAIKDSAGKAVTDAQVAIDYGMPAMSGMPAMNYKTGTTLKDKRYIATLDFSMTGAWGVTVKIARGGKTQSVKLNVDIK